MHSGNPPGAALAVLISGGLDSAILLGESLREQQVVHPLYVRCGLFWEDVELAHLRRYLTAIASPVLRPLQLLDLPVADLHPAHWSINGREVPDARSPDEAVFLPGRNVLLLSKAMLWCHLHQVPSVAVAHLGGNPFPDATPEFFEAFMKVVNQGIGGQVQVSRPYANLNKTAVMQRGRGLPLELTFSCLHPVNGKHCGQCNKCAERRRAFRDAGFPDATPYDRETACTV